MKIIDWYIIRKFVGTFFFILAMFTIIAVVFDTAEKLKDFLQSELGVLDTLTSYTQHFAMWFMNMLAPLLIFLSAIWVCSRMASRSENIAILSGGHSFNRFLRPYLTAGTFFFLLFLYMGHFVVPRSNFKKLQYENAYTSFDARLSNRYLEVEPGSVVYFQTFDFKTNAASRFSLKKFEERNGKRVKVYDLQAATAQGDSSTGHWTLGNYFIRVIGENGEKIIEGSELDTNFNFKGPDLGRRSESVYTMETPQLIEHRDAEIEKGSGAVAVSEVEIYSRTSTPFSVFILIVLAVCISYKKRRNGVGLNLIFGLAIGAISFFIGKVTSVAATNAGLPPLLAVWISNIVFGVVTLLFYLRARR